MPTTIHIAGEPRNDGSQRCSRCGLEIVPAGQAEHWPADQYVEVDEQEGDGLAVSAHQSTAGELPLCMSPSSPDATAPRPHRLGSDDE
ncbi:MAG: hypothetical protein ABI658_28885 [Acidimicrobiales bacterium]